MSTANSHKARKALLLLRNATVSGQRRYAQYGDYIFEVLSLREFVSPKKGLQTVAMSVKVQHSESVVIPKAIADFQKRDVSDFDPDKPGAVLDIVFAKSGALPYYDAERKEIFCALMGMRVAEFDEGVDTATLEGDVTTLDNMFAKLEETFPEGETDNSIAVGQLIGCRVTPKFTQDKQSVIDVRTWRVLTAAEVENPF